MQGIARGAGWAQPVSDPRVRHSFSRLSALLRAGAQGIARAKAVGFLDWDRPDCSFNLAEYEHYEQVENGDLNWIVPGTRVFLSSTHDINARARCQLIAAM